MSYFSHKKDWSVLISYSEYLSSSQVRKLTAFPIWMINLGYLGQVVDRIIWIWKELNLCVNEVEEILTSHLISIWPILYIFYFRVENKVFGHQSSWEGPWLV